MKKEQISWLLYDFANTGFMVWMVTLLFPVYFREVLCEGCGSRADLLWGLSGTCSMVLAALFAPILGAIADRFGLRKQFFIFFTLMAVFFSAALAMIPPGLVYGGMIFFILANVGYLGGMVFYNAFLPELERRERQGRFSAWGWAAGYLGAFVTLALFYPILKEVGDDWNRFEVRMVFVLQAVFFLLFSLPAFFFLPKSQRAPQPASWFRVGREGWRRLVQTFREIRSYKNLSIFWLAFFFFSEGISAVIYFASIFAVAELGFRLKALVLFYLVLQWAGIFGALLFGYWADRVCAKRALSWALFLWWFVAIASFWVEGEGFFYGIGMVAGMAMGSTQSVSRTYWSRQVPLEKRTEFFGFYGVASKLSSAMGPLLFGGVAALTGTPRWAALSLLLFFVLASGILRHVAPDR